MSGRLFSPPSTTGIKLPPMPPQVYPSDEMSEREKVEINIIKTLIASYYGIVKKNIMDSVPKSIM